MKIIYPPKNVVIQFNDLYEQLLHAQNMLHTESKNLAGIRDSLLPNLMSGEIKIL